MTDHTDHDDTADDTPRTGTLRGVTDVRIGPRHDGHDVPYVRLTNTVQIGIGIGIMLVMLVPVVIVGVTIGVLVR